MSDEYWRQHRAEYAGVGYYAMRANQQLASDVEKLSKQDPVARGVEFERGDPAFTGAAYIVEEVFGVSPDLVVRVCITPDPYKSPGRWRVSYSALHGQSEGYATTDQVRKYLG